MDRGRRAEEGQKGQKGPPTISTPGVDYGAPRLRPTSSVTRLWSASFSHAPIPWLAPFMKVVLRMEAFVDSKRCQQKVPKGAAKRCHPEIQQNSKRCHPEIQETTEAWSERANYGWPLSQNDRRCLEEKQGVIFSALEALSKPLSERQTSSPRHHQVLQARVYGATTARRWKLYSNSVIKRTLGDCAEHRQAIGDRDETPPCRD